MKRPTTLLDAMHMLRTISTTALLAVAATVLVSACTAPRKTDDMPRPLQLYAGAMEAISASDWAKARVQVEELLRIDGEPGDHALLAAVCAGEGDAEAAFRELSIAIETSVGEPGMSEFPESLRGDGVWEPLRADARFGQLVAKAESTRWKPDLLRFDDSPASTPLATRCSTASEEYLTKIRTNYGLDGVIAGAASDLDRIQRIVHWVHARTGHTGWPDGQPTDPLGLLDAAAKGASFRCVEYGIAAAGALQAVGIPARVVGSRARDVETRRLGAGHVFAEAWIADQGKWVFVDAQMDIVGRSRDGSTLDAIEFRNALAEGRAADAYPEILAMCMYYFDYSTDERLPAESRAGKRVTVAPLGAPIPRLFQREPTRAPDVFTHRPGDVYGPPVRD